MVSLRREVAVAAGADDRHRIDGAAQRVRFIAIIRALAGEAMVRAIFPDEDEARLKEDFFHNTRRGFFVDVGAFEPVRWSQTYALEQRGWNGVLIEPQPDVAARLRNQRRVPVYEVACSSPANSGKLLPLHLGGGRHASLREDYYIAGFKDKKLATVEVKVRTLDEILTAVGAPTPIDFVSIDVEFHELEVLDGFDLERWRPRLILIEDVAAGLQLHRYLRRRGYKWMRRTGLNGWYVPEDVSISVGLFGRWQFIRKHVLGVPFRRLRDAKRRWFRQ
jgi:FkbM family methyltransferase